MTVSVSELRSQLAAFRNVAESTRNDFRQTRDAIANDRMLSDIAKKEGIAAARDQANNRIETARLKEQQYIAASREKVEKAAFGIGFSPSTADVVAMRDAADRVEKVTDENQALSMYERAKQIGDKTMITALASRAYETGMRNLLEVHKQNSPMLASHLDSLAFLAESDTLEAQFRTGMAYSPVGDRY